MVISVPLADAELMVADCMVTSALPANVSILIVSARMCTARALKIASFCLRFDRKKSPPPGGISYVLCNRV